MDGGLTQNSDEDEESILVDQAPNAPDLDLGTGSDDYGGACQVYRRDLHAVTTIPP